jgi:uncharacterized delta-60 repeat protein
MKQLTPDEAPDLSFGDSNGGLEFESSVGAADVTLQPDGKFLVAGFKEKGRSTNGLLVRFLPNGKKDPSFGNRGRMSIGHKGNRASYVFDVDVLKNGRILASGTQSNQYMVMKLHPNGRFVKSFGNGGKKVLGVAGKRCRCELGRRFTRDRKGRILITGYVQPPKREKPIYGAIVRLKPNGKVDRSFGRRGVVRLYDGRSTKLYDIAVDKKGGIWTTGTGGPEFGKRRTSTIRLLPSGRLDRRTSRIGALSKPLGDAGAGWGLLPVGRSIYASGRWEKGGSESTYLRRFVPRR